MSDIELNTQVKDHKRHTFSFSSEEYHTEISLLHQRTVPNVKTRTYALRRM